MIRPPFFVQDGGQDGVANVTDAGHRKNGSSPFVHRAIAAIDSFPNGELH
jgi:hypothetical protein